MGIILMKGTWMVHAGIDKTKPWGVVREKSMTHFIEKGGI